MNKLVKVTLAVVLKLLAALVAWNCSSPNKQMTAEQARSASAPPSAVGDYDSDGNADAAPHDLLMQMQGRELYGFAYNRTRMGDSTDTEPGAMPSAGEELWIIANPSQQAPRDENTPGCGALMAKLPGEEKEIPLPLKHTDVQGHISASIATVGVTQQYHNPYNEKIEAVYVFPLPENAAVHEFIVTVGERRIRGIIREREEAERTYAEAKRQGYVASLLTQERPNIFTQKLANLEPGKAIDINITYLHTLAYDDGWYEFVFPMVVGPRFNPPGSTDGIGAVGRGKAGLSGQKTEVQYLRPGERSGHDISLAVDIDAGAAIEDVKSTSHAIEVQREASSPQAKVRLSSADTIPNRDFVLRYKVAGERIKSALLTHRDERGGFFTLMIYPPEDLRSIERAPVELVFVVDTSGSMDGEPMSLAKRAMRRALKRMGPNDTFQVIRFSDSASSLGPQPLPATPQNVKRGRQYVDELSAGGGTMMIDSIHAALNFAHDANRRRYVVFLTDGYIGNEPEIIGEIGRGLGDSRMFSFGIGSSPNRYLLDGMAQVGRGAVAYVGLNDDAAAVMDRFFDRVSHPALTDVAIDWGAMQVKDVYPQRMPDLFVGRPVILCGRWESGDAPATPIRITGRAGGRTVEMSFGGPANAAQVRTAARQSRDGSSVGPPWPTRNATEFPPGESDVGTGTTPGGSDGRSEQQEHPGLAFVWARLKIADLSNRLVENGSNEYVQMIRQTALEYGLMSAYTAFVAVDSQTQTAGDHGTTVTQSVPVPEGTRYETTVEE